MKILPANYFTARELDNNVEELRCRYENCPNIVPSVDLVELNEKLAEIIVTIFMVEKIGGMTIARKVERKIGNVEDFTLMKEILV